ncbi:hypothetical protein I4U23_020879 [Adineta vaga]|nr:hypothetical protein I4U23_020879 [Adineta vaga]
MPLKFVIYTTLFFAYTLNSYTYGDAYFSGSAPNVTGLTPDFSIFRTTSLFNSPITISLTVYQRPVNNTLKETLRIIDGNTTINSTGLCIGYGVSFQFLGQYPIINDAVTGNGGCDAILGKECSDNIRSSIQQSLKSITEIACGVNINTLLNIPQGCINKNSNNAFVSSNFLTNGSFMIDQSSASNSTVPWIYDLSATSTTNDYNELMKYFVLVYFLGRPYSSGIIDSAIVCLSTYNKTADPMNNQTSTQANGFAIPTFDSKFHLVFLILSYFISFPVL